MMDDLKVSVRDGIQIIIFNRPKRRNAFTRSMYKRISEILNSAAGDDAILLTVFTGEGEFFSSGNDMKAQANSILNDLADMEDKVKDGVAVVRELITSMIDYPKLLVAVVNGPAIGIGTTMLGLCDIVIASDKAYFLTPFVKLGLTAEGCSSITFPLIMGPRKATDMLFLGHKMSAEEAKQYNFVSVVVPHLELYSVWNTLYEYTKLSQESILSIKRLVRGRDRAALHLANEKECDELVKRILSDDFYTNIQNQLMKSSKL